MRQLLAFTKKEWTEGIRTGRFLILALIFVLFGIMNPAITKITPWLYETMADSLAEQGLILQQFQINALMSWQQYYKNISLMLIIFVLLCGNIVTGEYQKDTLIPVLTKGLARWKVIAAKGIMALLVWTVCHWMAYGITYAYNDYFWDNSEASHLFLASGCIYLLGIWLLAAILLGSALFKTHSAVLLFTGAMFGGVYLLGIVPTCAKFTPVRLLAAQELLTGTAAPSRMAASAVCTAVTAVLFLAGAILVFRKREI